MNPSKNKPGPTGRRIIDARREDGNSASPWSRTLRETIESIAIAFMLAFLFRTFEAEAFVIPTGSMAPTLMGKHLDITCPMCKFQYRVGALHDDEEDATRVVPAARDAEMIDSCICPNCGYPLDFAKMTPAERAGYVYYNGDRILVSKFAYDFNAPQRWDVIVFKFPEDAKTNYIKRLVGLPNEVVRIREGDIAVSHDNGKTFSYMPRSPGKLRSMLQMVYDDDHAFRPFVEKGWPAALKNVASGSETASGTWTAVASNSKEQYGPTPFMTTGKTAAGAPAEAWLRYSHYVPTSDDWQHFDDGSPLSYVDPKTEQKYPQPQEITDDNPYDTPFRGRQLGPSVPVDDLAVEFQADVGQLQGKLAVELVKQGRPFRCTLDLADGSAEMEIPDQQGPAPRAASGGISRTGSHQILFANVDHQLTLLVDDKQVQFDPPAIWSDVPPGSAAASSPASIGSLGAAVQVNHFHILRDIYYTYDAQREAGFPHYQVAPPGWPSDPQSWVCFPLDCVAKLQEAKADVRAGDQFFFIGNNQFFTLGDNSRLSQDGRFWARIHFVDRRLLIGKALVIYWPHSFDKVSIFGKEVTLPYWPNFGRMGYVR